MQHPFKGFWQPVSRSVMMLRNQNQGIVLRRLVCLVMLMLLLPLHGFAMQSGGAGAQALDFAHALEHALDVSHHHGNDGTVHYDDSDESVQHALESSAVPSSLAILPPAPVWSASDLRLIEPFSITFSVPDGIGSVPIRPPSSLG